jgi:hypothetical protein
MGRIVAEKNILILVEEKNNNLIQFLSYNVMLNSVRQKNSERYKKSFMTVSAVIPISVIAIGAIFRRYAPVYIYILVHGLGYKKSSKSKDVMICMNGWRIHFKKSFMTVSAVIPKK